MGVTERKEREKEDLRRSILTAAREVFLEKGFDQTSIRSIAQKIEYSPTTIYLYFKDKNEILYALHLEGFELLNQQMHVLFSVADPFERLIAMGRIYMKFALEYQDYYDLMFVQNSPMDTLCEKDEHWQEGQQAFDGLKMTIRECNELAYFQFENVEVAAFLIWSTMHGMVTLQNRGRCKILEEALQQDIVEKAYQEFISWLKLFKN